MAGVHYFFMLIFVSSLLSIDTNSAGLSRFGNKDTGSVGGSNAARLNIFPPSCNRIECPSYEMIEAGSSYEIRKYNSTMWMSTSAIQDISLVEATRNGFLQLFDYIQGKNEYNKKIEMTAPVLTQVLPSDGPFCESSFVVSFYIPKQNQEDPPPAKGLHVQSFSAPKYAAVRQFSGFVSDSDVGQQAAALRDSLSGSDWAAAIRKTDPKSPDYTVAQYNSPFESEGRINEIWLMFDFKKH